MEALAPPHHLLIEVAHSLGAGDTIRMGVLRYLSESEGEFNHQTRRWLIHMEQSSLPNDFYSNLSKPHRRMLLEVLDRGWRGQPIGEVLKALEEEFNELSKIEIEEHIQTLPFKMLIPMLLFQFPAIFLILVGPILVSLLEQLSGGL